jgi:DNA-binding transcriptional MocR family regulator
MGWALEAGRDKQLDPAARSVLVAIAYHANRWGRSWPSIDLIARDTGWTRKTISRAMASIEESGLVEVDRRHARSTLWIFPDEACPGRDSLTRQLSTGRDSEGIRRVTGTRDSVVESVKAARGAKNPTFLVGTGWVEEFPSPYPDGAA